MALRMRKWELINFGFWIADLKDCGFKGDSLKACSTKPTNSSGKPSKMTAGEPRQRRANILKCTLGAVANNGIRRKLKGQKSPILSIRSINVPCTYCLNCSSFNA
jgi:hypothetical protein